MKQFVVALQIYMADVNSTVESFCTDLFYVGMDLLFSIEIDS